MKYQNVVLGGTGHVGTALVNSLIKDNQSVMVIGHQPEKGKELQDKGVAYEVADVLDTNNLKELFGKGERLFILNPPAPPHTDTVKEESKSVQSILTALDSIQFKKIVAASTYGAQKGNAIGDLGTLYELEQGLFSHPSPVAVIRSAYYMSNWTTLADVVTKDGILSTLYPHDFKLPMIAPEDIGVFAAALMLNDKTGLHFAEGPERYSPDDVATAFGKVLSRDVKVATTPETHWQASLRKNGFSSKAAKYMASMTQITLDNNYEIVDPHLGKVVLQEYIGSQLKK
jgi:uncharacterized protein YbjT (DUF2867 family)